MVAAANPFLSKLFIPMRFDYLFGKNVKFGKPILTQSNVSDHLPVTCDVITQ